MKKLLVNVLTKVLYKKFMNKTLFVDFSNILTFRQKALIGIFLFSQFVLGMLDFIGVLSIGLIVGISISNNTGTIINSNFLGLIEFLETYGLSANEQLGFLSLSVVCILLIKTFLSMYLIRKIMFFMGQITTELSKNLITEIFKRPLTYLTSSTSQKQIFTVTRGVDYLILFVLAPAIILFSDFLILLVFVIGLITIDPIMLLILVTILGFTGFLTFNRLNRRSRYLGVKSANLNIQVNDKVSESLNLYREILVRNAAQYYVNSISTLRNNLSKSTAEFNLIPYISKYVLEGTVVLIVVTFALLQFVLGNAYFGATNLVVFLAAFTRVIPIVLRVQQSIVTISGSIGMAMPTLALIRELKLSTSKDKDFYLIKKEQKNFIPVVSLKSVNFSYDQQGNFQLKNFNLEIPQGERVAIVGPSGSGKSTLLDLILGMIQPISGSVLISNESPGNAFSKWPGKIAYVPQSVGLVNGSILENILFGFNLKDYSDLEIEKVVSKSALSDLIKNSQFGLQSNIGENGVRLSAGQKQRLGIARAFITNPSLIIFDEATSALDSITEDIVSTAIQSLDDSVTVITVAHRLSTVKNADRIIYLEGGSIVSQGSFLEVRSNVPSFDKQAKLMGL